MTLDNDLLVVIISAIVAILTSGGIWTYLASNKRKQTAERKLLIGLAQHRIVSQGMRYIERGWLTKDEYDDFLNLFYEPYREVGGNGLGEKVMKDVINLPIAARERNVNTTEVRIVRDFHND